MKVRCLWFSLLLAACSNLFGQGAPVSGNALVTLTPTANSLPLQSTLTVSVGLDLSGVTGQGPSGRVPAVLGGYQIAVTFDPSRLRFENATGGTASGFTGTPTFTSPSSANGSGSVTIVASQTSSTAPTGNVMLAQLTFTAVGAGSTALSGNATSLSTAFQPPSFGPSSIPGTAGSTTVTINAPLAAPSNPSPSNQAGGVAMPVTISWSAVPGATLYEVQFGTNSTPAPLSTTGTTSLSVSTVAGTTYYWAVKASNSTGSVTGPVWSFTTAGTSPCPAPATPTLNGPAEAASGTPFTLSWSAIPGATGYQIQESKEVPFVAPLNTAVTGTSATLTRTVSADTIFYFRIAAVNEGPGCSATGGFSSIVAVTVRAVVAPPPEQIRVIPVAGSVAGLLGSVFRTTLQLFNPSDAMIQGKVVFHPLRTSASKTDPSVVYEIGSGQTVSFADLLGSLSVTGIGSVDLVSSNSFPVAVATIVDDGGILGTMGTAEEIVAPEDALHAGERGALIAPPDRSNYRFNIGVRSLADGASLSITVRNAQGVVLTTMQRDYAPSFFDQTTDSEFVGRALTGGESISILVKSGAAIVYGATTDNRTQDPRTQLARKIR